MKGRNTGYRNEENERPENASGYIGKISPAHITTHLDRDANPTKRNPDSTQTGAKMMKAARVICAGEAASAPGTSPIRRYGSSIHMATVIMTKREE